MEQLWKNLVIAGLYGLVGMLTLLLPLPASHAAPIWPAAGLAVAMLLIWGSRCWPGVWLGFLLTSPGLEPSFDVLGVNALMAGAATVQAVLAAWLARRYQQGPWPFGHDGGLVLFLALTGPLVSLLSSSFCTTALLLSGRIAGNEWFNEWLHWWSGDILGVMLFAPLILMLWPGRHSFRLLEGGSYRFVLPLLVTTALLVLGYSSLAHLSELRVRSDTRTQMESIVNEGTQDIAEALFPLDGLANFIAASEAVSREEFHGYIRRFIKHPAIHSLDWAPRVTLAQRDEFEAAVIREGFSEFRISELNSGGRLQTAGRRSEYFPILFSESLAPSRSMLGFDHGSEILRHQAMDTARHSGKAIASDLTRLYRTERHAFLMFIPVWLETDASRTQEPSGYVVAVFDLQQLLAPLLSKAAEHRLALRLSDLSSGRAFIDTLPDDTSASTAWHHDFHLGARTWRLELQPNEALLQPGARIEESLFLFLFLGFAVVTAFLAVFSTLSSAGRQTLISQRVAERTEQLQHELDARSAAELALQASEERYRSLIEQSPLGVIVQDDGCCLFANSSALAMFGARTEDELLGRNLLALVAPDSRPEVLARLARLATGNTDVRTIRVHYHRLDGLDSWMEVTCVPYRHEGRNASLILLNDISARLQAEEQRDRFFDLSLDLFCIADMNGHFRTVNPAFTRTLGWSEQELLSRPFIEFVHPDDVDATLETFRQLAAGGNVSHFENRYRCKDGSWRWLTWKTLQQPGGIWFATARDTTEQHLAAQQLRELNTKLKQRIEERSRALAKLHDNREEIRAVLDHLLDCVITLDSRGLVQNVNAAIKPLLGYRPEELVGQNIACLMPSSPHGQHEGHLARELRSGAGKIIGSRREVTGLHKNGQTVSLELSVSEYYVRGERFLIGILRDIRERKTLIASLTQAREEAEQASRAKSAFLATMSHEIRTPMNGVIGLVDVLAQDDLSPRQADLIETIRQSSNNLLGIIDDILDFSKIEAGRLDIEQAPLHLPELIDGLCSSLKPMARAGGVALEWQLDDDLPRWVDSDATRLRQILYNLVGNAIKFSGGRRERPGRVEVSVRLAEKASQVSLVVADNGIGIAPEHLQRLFTPFAQAESSTTRRFGGTGLGLAICKRLVDLLHGEITVDSTLGRGTAFTVTLPFAPAQAPAAASAEPPAEGTVTGRILVVEDDAVNRKVIQQQLIRLGYAFNLAANGAEALQLWRSGSYDLVLSDLHMPEMDGYQLAERIRQAEARTGRARMPILALTANALRSEAQRAIEAGMDAYLTKPIRLAALQAELARWLCRERPRPPAMPEPASVGNSEPVRLLDPATLNAVFGDEPDMIDDILRSYVQSLGTQTQQLQDAAEHGDNAAIGSIAHSLKSASLAVGALALGQLCAELEQLARKGDAAAVLRGIAEFKSLQAATARSIGQLLLTGELFQHGA